MDSSEPKIKHIVCSGGGATGFAFYGIIRETHKKGLWNFDDIETIYGTSVGSIFCFLFILIDSSGFVCNYCA